MTSTMDDLEYCHVHVTGHNYYYNREPDPDSDHDFDHDQWTFLTNGHDLKNAHDQTETKGKIIANYILLYYKYKRLMFREILPRT